MYILYDYFHRKTKDLNEGGLVSIPKSRTEWPESWKTVSYKIFERAKRIILRRHTPHPADFYAIAASRVSPDAFTPGALALEQLSQLLQLSYGENNDGFMARRPVPSGGARYPLEMYALVWDVEGLEPGVYHYNIKENVLEHLFWKDFSKADIVRCTSYPWVETGSALLIMTAQFSRSTQKYGSRGYRYTLLEAGHVGQMIHLNAKYLGFNARALGGTKDDQLEDLLDINGSGESVVYTIGIGK